MSDFDRTIEATLTAKAIACIILMPCLSAFVFFSTLEWGYEKIASGIGFAIFSVLFVIAIVFGRHKKTIIKITPSTIEIANGKSVEEIAISSIESIMMRSNYKGKVLNKEIVVKLKKNEIFNQYHSRKTMLGSNNTKINAEIEKLYNTGISLNIPYILIKESKKQILSMLQAAINKEI
jgi:hypothetical protein